MFFTLTYADFKLIAAQFTSGHLFFFDSGTLSFKVWGMASGFPVLACYLSTGKPASFATDFPSAIQLANPLQVDVGGLG